MIENYSCSNMLSTVSLDPRPKCFQLIMLEHIAVVKCHCKDFIVVFAVTHFSCPFGADFNTHLRSKEGCIKEECMYKENATTMGFFLFFFGI